MAVLKTEDIGRNFGGLAALNGVNVEIGGDEIVGLIGPNGAGKTTFTNVIAGVYFPSAGKIFFNGEDISYLPPYERCRRGIARTFQLVRPVHELNMVENIMVGALFGQSMNQKKARNKALELCEFMEMKDLGRGVSAMTVLEVKKMEIAHALATNPSFLFLDEVMAGLNGDETNEMIQMVRKINKQGITIVIIEHVMAVIKELTHRVVVLNFGQVLAEGPYSKVSHNPQVISAYLGEDATC